MAKNGQFTINSFSVIVAAASHNPSILNPDFLKIKNIIPKDFEVEEAISTPPIAAVKYKNGIQITVESEKLQVVKEMLDETQDELPIPSIAIEYVRVLPHVRYIAVGINWNGFFKTNDPAAWVRKKYLKEGKWTEKPYGIEDISVRLVYPLDEIKFNMTIGSGRVAKREEQPVPAVVVKANFHHQLGGDYPNFEEVVKIIKEWQTRKKNLVGIMADFLGVEV